MEPAVDPLRCAVCGRSPRQSDALPARYDGIWASPAEVVAWSSIGGRDVCPEDQTDQERLAVRQRLRAMVEREVERRQREGIALDETEEALLEFTLGLESGAAASAEPFPVAAPDRGVAPVRLVVTGAVLTDHPLVVPADRYEAVRDALEERLTASEWSLVDPRVEQGTYESGGGLSADVPLVLARRSGSDRLAGLAFDVDAGRGNGAGQRVVRAEPTALAIDIYDAGVAVLTAEFDLRGAVGEVDVLVRALEERVLLRESDRSPFVTALQEFAQETVGDYGKAVGVVAEHGARPWPAEIQDAASGAAPPESDSEPGRLLWLHPVLVVATEDVKTVARSAAPTFSRRIRVNGGVYVAGIGSSTFAVRTDAPEAEVRSALESMPLRLTLLHWAYYALYLGVDRGLLQLLDQPYWQEAEEPSLEQLEGDAEFVFACYLSIMNARARLDSALAARGGDELAIWDAIAQVQRFDALVESVDRKLDTLERLADRRVALAAVRRGRRTDKIFGALTVLTLVSVTGAAFSLLFGAAENRAEGLGVRVGVVLVSVLLAVLAFRALFANRARTSRTTGRSPHAFGVRTAPRARSTPVGGTGRRSPGTTRQPVDVAGSPDS